MCNSWTWERFYGKSRKVGDEQIPLILGLEVFHKSHQHGDHIQFVLVWLVLLNYGPIFHKTPPCCSFYYAFCCFLFIPFSNLLKWLTRTYLGDTELFLDQLVLSITQAKFKDLKFQRIQWKQTRSYTLLETGLWNLGQLFRGSYSSSNDFFDIF